MNDHIFKSDQIPNNPLEMPPPYWRSSGAIFHILDALHNLPRLLSELISVHGHTELRLGEYYEQHLDEASNDDELEEFGEICNDLWELEHRIKLKAELVILMSGFKQRMRLIASVFLIFTKILPGQLKVYLPRKSS